MKTFERLPPMDSQWQKYKDATDQSLHFIKHRFAFIKAGVQKCNERRINKKKGINNKAEIYDKKKRHPMRRRRFITDFTNN
ncbi:hypothetical protein [Hafnia alvei]|nr:hypothetical protein [Hafnia alvei]AJR00209.1 hypothetical protein F652_2219 [Enterobacteriaceae bacterium bta3-1]QQE44031.1 hypothetical protein I6H95_01570 [Hafnia alvei]